jgi:hypothetical protein
VSTSGADSPAGAPARPRLPAAELLAAKNTRPIQPPGDLAADIFESDEELEEDQAEGPPGARIKSAATIPGPGPVSCDRDASGLTMIYLAGKLLP